MFVHVFQLLSLRLLCITSSYNALYSKLVNIGAAGPGMLEFAEAVLHLLDVSAVIMDSSELLWRLWSTVVNPLHEFILKVQSKRREIKILCPLSLTTKRYCCGTLIVSGGSLFEDFVGYSYVPTRH